MRRGPIAAAAVLSLALNGGLGVSTAVAACSKTYEVDHASTSVAADGAKMTWTARAMTASDWQTGGFAAEVLWVGTNQRPVALKWVEGGVTQGWEGANILTLYTAHGDKTVTPNIYAEHRFTAPAVVLGANYTFAGFSNLINVYRMTVNAPNGNSWDWSGHDAITSTWDGGSESTCAAPSKVSKTFVSVNQYRRQQDHVYVNAAVGSLAQDAGGGIAWCVQPRTFRYWMNDPNSAGCS